MKTAVEKMIQYFIEKKNNGASHWCINDLLGQLQQAKAMEKEQMKNACIQHQYENKAFQKLLEKQFEQYYNKTFKS